MSEEVAEHSMRCLICRRELQEVFKDPASVGQPNDATAWTTTGHYGSTVYDPVSEHQYLEAYICDGCLRERADLVVTVRPKPIRREWEHRSGIHDDPESYAPYSEMIALLRKLEAQARCPVCGGEGRTHHKPCRLNVLLSFMDMVRTPHCAYCGAQTADSERCGGCGIPLCGAHCDGSGNLRCARCVRAEE